MSDREQQRRALGFTSGDWQRNAILCTICCRYFPIRGAVTTDIPPNELCVCLDWEERARISEEARVKFYEEQRKKGGRP